MPLRCFLVDDSRDFLEAATTLLERGGMKVVGSASTPDEAVRRVRELRPDVTLVDIDLGGASGFDVVEQLREDGLADASPVILISTHPEDEFADLIEASSATGFLAKSRLSGAAINAVLAAAGP